MSFLNEFRMLMASDLSDLSISQLVSKPGLWWRNTIIHFGFGFVGFFVSHHWARSKAFLSIALIAYVLQQIIQLWSDGAIWILILDGVFDIFVLYFGYLIAFWLAMRSIKQEG